MTGAEKLMFDMFAGGWKFGGRPPRGCEACACCICGGDPTPGAADIPGGGPLDMSVHSQLSLIRSNEKTYPCLAEGPYQVATRTARQNTGHSPVADHKVELVGDSLAG